MPGQGPKADVATCRVRSSSAGLSRCVCRRVDLEAGSFEIVSFRLILGRVIRFHSMDGPRRALQNARGQVRIFDRMQEWIQEVLTQSVVMRSVETKTGAVKVPPEVYQSLGTRLRTTRKA